MRYIHILLAMFMVVGCNREDGSGVGAPTDAINFSAGSISRGVETKDSWTVGDKVAIFVADSEGVYSGEAYCYEITATSGTMDATDERIYNDGVATGFCAFYPFDSQLSSYDDYMDRGSVSDSAVDYLYCGTTEVVSGVVNFVFNHIYSILTFNYSWGYEYDSSDSFTSTLLIGSESYVLDIEEMSASLFVAPSTDLSSVTLTTVVTSVVPNRVYLSDLSEVISEWVSGDVHQYNNVVVGTADLFYNISTEEYEVYSPEGLKAFADLVNGEDNTSGATVAFAVNEFGEANAQINGKMMNSLDLSTICSSELGVNWTPIGMNANSPYEGEFDGNNKFVYKLYINDTQGEYLGLFGSIYGAKISNVTVVDGSVIGRYYYVGGLAGYASGASVIKSCRYDGEVCGGYNVGGLVGQSNNVTLISSYATGEAMALTNYVGGLIGQVATGGAMLFGCYSGVDVSCFNSGADAGGLIGEISSGAPIVLYGCYFWYGANGDLVSVGDVNGTLNSLQEGYSLEELNGADCIAELNSGVDYWCSLLPDDNVVNYTYVAGELTPEFELKR